MQTILKCNRNFFILYAACIIYTALVFTRQLSVAFFGFVVLITLLLAITKRVKYAAYLSLYTLINTQLSNVYFSEIYVSYICFVILVVYSLLDTKTLRNICRKKSKLIWILIAFSGYVILNAIILNPEQILHSSCSMIINAVVCVSSLVIVKKSQKDFVNVVTFSVFVMVATGYLEHLIGHTFLYSEWTGAERYRLGILRIGSTMADPNFVCSVLVPMFFILQQSLFKTINGKTVNRVLSILMVLLCVGTVSRMGIVALLVGLFIAYISNSLKVTLALSPAIIAAGYVGLTIIEKALTLDIDSTSARNTVVRTALLCWKDSPIIGKGWDWFSKYSATILGMQWDTMNTYVYMLVNLGIIGIVLLVLYLFASLKPDLRKYIHGSGNIKRRDETFAIAAGLSWMLMAYSLDIFNISLLWLLPSLIYKEQSK